MRFSAAIERFINRPVCDQNLVLGAFVSMVDTLAFVQLYHPEITKDEAASMIASELFAEPAIQEATERASADDDICATCGHTRKQHCGCGKLCLAPTTDPPTPVYYTDEEVDWWIKWWKDETPVAISKLLSNPERFEACTSCSTGFVLKMSEPESLKS